MGESNEPNGPGGGRLSHADVVRLSEQVANLAAAGLPLGPGLIAAAEEMPRGRLASSLSKLGRSLDQGLPLDQAVEAQGRRLPEHLRTLVAAGVRTGRVSDVLGRFVAFTSTGQEIRRKLWVSLAYPLFALILAVALFMIVCVVLVGTFSTIFEDFGINLPKITVALILLAKTIERSAGPLTELLAFLVVLWVAARLFLRPEVRRSLASGLPVIGVVWRNTSLAEFCQLLALLLESGVPLPEAIRLTGDGVGDASFEKACGAMGRDVDGGLTLSQAVARQPLFPRGLARVLAWSEGHQNLPGALRMAGEMFGGRAKSQASFAGTVFSVMALLTILVGIGPVSLGLFLPLIQLINALSG